MPPFTHIMIHHSLTEDSNTVSWGAIRRYHMDVLKWHDIGYHFGVEKIQSGQHTSFEVLKGRDLFTEGAHCKEGHMNQRALGICVVGNFDLVTPDAAAIEKLMLLCGELMHLLHIPHERIVTHRDYAPYKSCPGQLFPMALLHEVLRDER